MICGKSLVTTAPVGDVDDGRHGDPAGIVGVAGEVGLLQPLDAEHRVAAARVEVEGPAALVVGGAAACPSEMHVLEAEQAAHDDRPVRPRAGRRRDQPVAARLDRPDLHVAGAVRRLVGSARRGDPVRAGRP